jgi:hypothetical protein
MARAGSRSPIVKITYVPDASGTADSSARGTLALVLVRVRSYLTGAIHV